ncbi:MAG: hypothetical protein JWM72_1431 [Actinomycetia bacterium]|nr:hypothetical protein [Actinomycetes bacterium]
MRSRRLSAPGPSSRGPTATLRSGDGPPTGGVGRGRHRRPIAQIAVCARSPVGKKGITLCFFGGKRRRLSAVGLTCRSSHSRDAPLVPFGSRTPVRPASPVVSGDASAPAGASSRPQAFLTAASGRTQLHGGECMQEPDLDRRPAFPPPPGPGRDRALLPPAPRRSRFAHCDVRRIGAGIGSARLTVRGRRCHASCSGLALGGAGMRWFMAWCVPDRALQVRAGRAISPSQEAAASPYLRLAPGFVRTGGTLGRSPAPPQGR